MDIYSVLASFVSKTRSKFPLGRYIFFRSPHCMSPCLVLSTLHMRILEWKQLWRAKGWARSVNSWFLCTLQANTDNWILAPEIGTARTRMPRSERACQNQVTKYREKDAEKGWSWLWIPKKPRATDSSAEVQMKWQFPGNIHVWQKENKNNYFSLPAARIRSF